MSPAAQSPQAQRVMTLGKTDAASIRQQRAMIKLRRGESERAIEQQLPRGAPQQIHSTNYFRDSHGRVIHYYRQLIRGHLIASPHHEVTEVFSRDERLWAEPPVVERNDFS